MSPDSSEGLGRDRRLRSSRDFESVKALGTALRGKHCLLLALLKPGEATRVGFVASKKGVGGSVQRNRARRRLREIVRRRFPRLPASGYWLAVIAFRSALTASHQELASDVERLLALSGALSPIEEPELQS
jgi:ribonuclease P protein component